MRFQHDRFLASMEHILLAYQLAGVDFKRMYGEGYITFFIKNVPQNCPDKYITITIGGGKSTFYVVGGDCGVSRTYTSNCDNYEGLPKRFINAMKKLGF